MSRAIVGLVAIVSAMAGSMQTGRLNAVGPQPPSQAIRLQQRSAGHVLPASSPQRALLAQYCVSCHNERLKTAGLMLDKLDPERVGDAPAVWEKVVGKLRSRAMPPAGMPRPDEATFDAFASWLETALDRAAAITPNPGRSAAVHRLNRSEYTHAIRDLLSVEIDSASLLPGDDSGYGFDNIADVLSLSPALLDRYMLAAGKISRLAIGDPSIRPFVQTYRLSPTLLQEDRMSEDLPFGSRGGIAVRHLFPVDGEYLFKIVLQRFYGDGIRGLGERNQIEVRVDRARIKRFTVGADGPRTPWMAIANPTPYERTADEDLEVRVPVKAGRRLVAVTFVKKNSVTEGVLEPRLGVRPFEFTNDKDAEMGVDSVGISGPYNAKTPGDTSSRRQIFVCYPTGLQDEEPCAKRILYTLARRAYRRPVADNDVETLLGFYRAGRAKGSFEAGIQLALRAVLVDPDFLFRVERDPVNVPARTAYRVSDVELASRLSFFLWASIPDDQLLDLAARGKLKDPTVLEQQVRRMLGDTRSNALTSNFVGQWLHVRNMREVAPDPDAFPTFDENLREAFLNETELFVESQRREDRSVVDLLSANYTFVNERLARHYGIPNIYGNRFRRVTFPENTPRGGLLGHGSILTVTSYAHRTAPTLRGKWVLENLLGAPPPPPPANVPSLEENAKGSGKLLSVRERLEQHRRNPACASCHARMDPLGFALENFDAIGEWRATTEANTTIDASGALPGGVTFEGSAGLRDILLQRRDEFARGMTEKLLTYALGRGLEYYDLPAVRKIMREAAPNDYKWSSIIVSIVKSMPFQMRRTES
jgi:mono/diheme cytochrome c family protein